MAQVPNKVATRLAAGLKRFQPILQAARSRDVNESDTVVIVMDMLQEIFGYDKYAEITSEHLIRGTFCDLAIKLEGGLQMLIEVKAIGLELKDSFLKQAVDYAANQGTEWVVLTNGVRWRAYKVIFGKPIEHELVLDLHFADLNPRNEDHVELLWLLAKEGWQKARLGEYHTQRQALSRFFLGAVVQTDPVLDVIRRELRRLSPGVKIETDEILSVLTAEVLKREVLDGDKAAEAKRQIARASSRALRSRKEKEPSEQPPPPSSTVPNGGAAPS
jgi:hypothetical protein